MTMILAGEPYGDVRDRISDADLRYARVLEAARALPTTGPRGARNRRYVEVMAEHNNLTDAANALGLTKQGLGAWVARETKLVGRAEAWLLMGYVDAATSEDDAEVANAA